LPHLLSITTEERDAALIMDPATRRNLELDESLAGRPELTLAGVFDHTATAMGARLLRRWLHRPLRDHDALRLRYHAVATLIDGARHVALAELLRSIGDLERILARVALRSARPRDLTQLRTALGALPSVHRSLRATLESAPSPLLQQLLDELSDHRDEHAVLERAVVDGPRRETMRNSTNSGCWAATPNNSCWSWSGASASVPGCPASSWDSIACKASSSR